MVQYLAMAVGTVSLVLVTSINLPRLRRWSQAQAALRDALSASGADTEAAEPLLPSEAHGSAHHAPSAHFAHPTGGDVMAEEAIMAHREADMTAAFFVEGETLQESQRQDAV
jgi:hypothetical protein